MASVARIVSGGQSGVDRAALDVALRLGIPYAGWCPAGGWAEDLPVPPGVRRRFPLLREAGSADGDERTRLNVHDSDATLVLAGAGTASAGTMLTIQAAEELGRPVLVVTPEDLAGAAEVVRAWLATLAPHLVLNVAGPRASEWPEGYDVTTALLLAVWTG
ncbi:putative molybdenum carrier protein [Nocardioides sp.]|uniref:putative molybdenum carrier protein n=1 Tax=Nocardioides sp. TaxID=35761 RepID=UPI002C580A2C|nr:putative molybdenum carrier protein [Nocardioides sp.]HSX66003.1 putative molybdenum carrier protein [Nocardioides sp.]